MNYKFNSLTVHFLNLQDLVDEIEGKVNLFLENQWLSKHPDKKKELLKNNQEFDKSLIEKKELIDLNKRFNKKDLEVFSQPNLVSDAFRSYLFKRMNNVSKLVFKIS